MPVKHNLYADLGVTAEQFEALKKKTPHLGELETRYLQKDKEVVEAEQNASEDDLVTRLRKERLEIKDRIASQVKSA